jgi:hypothetical protein
MSIVSIGTTRSGSQRTAAAPEAWRGDRRPPFTRGELGSLCRHARLRLLMRRRPPSASIDQFPDSLAAGVFAHDASLPSNYGNFRSTNFNPEMSAKSLAFDVSSRNSR